MEEGSPSSASHFQAVPEGEEGLHSKKAAGAVVAGPNRIRSLAGAYPAPAAALEEEPGLERPCRALEEALPRAAVVDLEVAIHPTEGVHPSTVVASVVPVAAAG